MLVSVFSSCFTFCLNVVDEPPALFGFCCSNSVAVTLDPERILWAQWAGAVSSSSLPVTVPVGARGQTQALHPALFPALSFLINECSLSPEGSSEVCNSILYCWFSFSQGPTVPSMNKFPTLNVLHDSIPTPCSRTSSSTWHKIACRSGAPLLQVLSVGFFSLSSLSQLCYLTIPLLNLFFF